MIKKNYNNSYVDVIQIFSFQLSFYTTLPLSLFYVMNYTNDRYTYLLHITSIAWLTNKIRIWDMGVNVKTIHFIFWILLRRRKEREE